MKTKFESVGCAAAGAVGNDFDEVTLTGMFSHSIITCDLHSNITICNDSSERMSGYAAAEIIGHNLSVLATSHGGSAFPSSDMMARALRDGFCEGTAAFRHKGGGTVVRPVLIVPQRDESGRLSGFLIVAVAAKPSAAPDAGAVQALQAKIEAFDAVNRGKDRFLSQTLHDFRTSLGGVIGFAGTLLMRLAGPLTADQERQLNTIEVCAKDLLSQLDRLPDALRIETGTIDAVIGEVSCRAVIEKLAPDWRERAAAKGLTFDVAIVGGDVALRTDPWILGQILARLVDNAVTYTLRGGVVVACDPVAGMADQVRIEVRDTGVGLSAEDQDKLFRPFTLLASSAGRKHGPGHGLHQAQKLAGLIGGRVSCLSAPGQGSVFTLTVAGGGGNGANSGD